jgi:DNA polymerase III subunit delta'
MNELANKLETYPWQRALWTSLTQDRTGLVHALLLHGQIGLGKSTFATQLSTMLLCEKPNQSSHACGRCKSCHLVRAGTHPDLKRVEPVEEGRVITVEQVRALVEFMTTRPHIAQRKVVMLMPAESMNTNAANSLLKILEEPPLGNVFILVSHQPAKLPATIRSRCSQIEFKPPPRDDGIDWLQTQDVSVADAVVLLGLAGGAPLRALELDQAGMITQREQLLADLELLRAGTADVVACAARWHKIGADFSLGWLQRLVADMVKVHMVAQPEPFLANHDLACRLHALGEGLDLKQLYGFADAISEARDLLASPVDNLLLLEDILIRWFRVTRKITRPRQ